MKLYVGLFHVICVFAIVGSTLGDDADDDCPRLHGMTLLDMVSDSITNCFVKKGELDLEDLALTHQYIPKPEFEHYCSRHDLIKNCLSTISAKYSACHTETQREVFVLLEEFLITSLGFSCVSDGELLGMVSRRVFEKEGSSLHQNALTDCFATAKATPAEPNTATDFLRLYRELKVFKQCLITKMQWDDTDNRAIFVAELMLNGILRSMKCSRPEDGTHVPCATLEATPSTEEHLCPVKSGEPDSHPRLGELFDYATRCALVNVDHLEFGNLANMTLLSDYQGFFKTYCHNAPLILDCIGDVTVTSNACINETNQQLLNTITKFMETSLEIVCRENGNNLAIVVNGILNTDDAERAVSRENMRECGDKATDLMRSGEAAADSIASRILLSYRTLGTIKKCILDAASDEGTFKTVFDSSMNEVIRTAKCISPADGSLVVCETLLNNN